MKEAQTKCTGVGSSQVAIRPRLRVAKRLNPSLGAQLLPLRTAPRSSRCYVEFEDDRFLLEAGNKHVQYALERSLHLLTWTCWQ